MSNNTLNPSQLSYAKTIAGVGKQMGAKPRDVLIALMTAITESGLKNYANANNPDSLAIAHDAVGNDHGSVGLFQQQVGGATNSTANWGTTAQLMNPVYAAQAFFTKELKLSDRATAAPSRVAQEVQGSAFADGSNYAANQNAAGAAYVQAVGPRGLIDMPGITLNPIGDASGTPDTIASLPGVSTVKDLNGAIQAVTRNVTSTEFWIRMGFIGLGALLLLIGFDHLTNGGITGGSYGGSPATPPPSTEDVATSSSQPKQQSRPARNSASGKSGKSYLATSKGTRNSGSITQDAEMAAE